MVSTAAISFYSVAADSTLFGEQFNRIGDLPGSADENSTLTLTLCVGQMKCLRQCINTGKWRQRGWHDTRFDFIE